MGENTKHVGRNSALFSHYRVRIYRSKTTRIFRRVQKNRSIGRSMRLESSIMREILKRSFPSPDYRSKSVRYPKWMYANQKS